MPNIGKRCAMRLQPLQNEQGAILVIALCFVCILAIAGTMAYQMTATEIMIARNFDDSKEALNAASAGIEEARVRMGLPTTDTNVIYDSYSSVSWTDTPASLQSDLSYQIEVSHKTDAGDLVYYGCEDLYPLTTNPADLTLKAFPYATPTEYRPVDIITSEGTGDRSGTRIQAEVAHYPGPPILAALYAEVEIEGNANGYQVNVSGYDSCGTGITKYDVYLCNPWYWYDEDSTTDSSTLETENTSPLSPLPTITPGSTNINITQGIASLKVWETSATCYNSDYNICSSTGATVTTAGSGTLLVEGDLTLRASWDGLILVDGDLYLQGGSAGILIDGAVLVNGWVIINDNIIGNEGDVTINYNSCKIQDALSSIPLRVLSWADLSITD